MVDGQSLSTTHSSAKVLPQFRKWSLAKNLEKPTLVALLMGIACIARRTLADSSVCTGMAVGILATRRVWALAWILTVVVDAGLSEGTVSVLLTFTHLD